MKNNQAVATRPAALNVAEAKSELDINITTAKEFPRDVAEFMGTTMRLVTTSEEIAESCMYALPRGDKTIVGASARFAEVIQGLWKNNHAAARVVDEEEEFVIAQGVFFDLENNTKVTREVKRRITDSKGRRYNADMIMVTGNAAASIAYRNAILAGIPKAFWQPMYDAAVKMAVGDKKTLAKKRSDALEYLAKMGVHPPQVFAALGVKDDKAIGLEELAVLKGAIQAVKSGELTIEAAFAPKEVAGAETKSGKPATDAPQSKSAGNKKDDAPPISMDQQTVLADRLKEEGVPLNAFLVKLKVANIELIPAARYKEACDAIDELSA